MDMQPLKTPYAITMWDFSWLERRWPGAGFENIDKVLDELQERGYNAVRIDAFPHFIYHDREAVYEILPCWNVQDWGSPGLNRIRVEPSFSAFVKKCAEKGVKVALSTWWREDKNKSYATISSPEKLARVWLSVLRLLDDKNLLSNILWLDLSNEWALPVWTPFNKEIGGYQSEKSKYWMAKAIERLRKEYPEIQYTFSTTEELTDESINKANMEDLDLIEHHIWMAQANKAEFYNNVGYHYARFEPGDYENLARKGKKCYLDGKEHWDNLLKQQISYAAEWSRKCKKPLATTECWGVVDYKDFPLLDWDWVKGLCELGTREACSTGRWMALATSNFCGPQFKGMWRDIEWHKKLTKEIRESKIDQTLIK